MTNVNRTARLLVKLCTNQALKRCGTCNKLSLYLCFTTSRIIRAFSWSYSNKWRMLSSQLTLWNKHRACHNTNLISCEQNQRNSNNNLSNTRYNFHGLMELQLYHSKIAIVGQETQSSVTARYLQLHTSIGLLYSKIWKKRYNAKCRISLTKII